MFDDLIKDKEPKSKRAPFVCISCHRPLKRGHLCPKCNPPYKKKVRKIDRRNCK
jgi:hypothetical protein